ncbi:D-alanyl-D-alanine carboxypeptidase DacA [Pullulanibacillus camelliae]|uniref:serine-type D-Ala-D-Ala carboxypeptidase n=1 Tax=Pullulanibacillus camelliae TaxID=1707096 RepID=A0A8J2YJF9_9BACL|nr:D-alanyl-D-alanine carboxypeptidase family protein [Pullulanibacillus camelliae]GGE48092.1 D-alanyl-D-alanine carboxypeptidase DacA [Pullulanibacillus camelliae]
MYVSRFVRQSIVLSIVSLLIIATLFHPRSAAAATNGPSIQAKAAILVDANTGKILYAKNIDEKLPPASMTKLMTEYLIMKALADGKIKWTTTVPVDQKVFELSRNSTFSGFSLRKDYKYSVESMFDALLIPSSNAAAVAFAELLGNGNESNFVDQMNQTAKKLGMKDTVYINASGLDNVDLGKYKAQGDDNATDLLTPRDLAMLAYHIMNDFPKDLTQKVLKVASTTEKDFQAGPGEVDHMVNTNWMLTGFGDNMRDYKYEGVDGLKTGFTSLAGYCFTGSVQRGDKRFISVVMGTKSEGDRFLQTKKLYDYGFQQVADKQIVKSGQTFKGHTTLPVTKGKEDHVKIAVKDGITLPVAEGNEKNYKAVLHLNKSLLNKDGKLEAPVKKGEKVGYVTIESKGQDYGYINNPPKVDVVTQGQVDKSNGFVLMMRAIGHFISGIFSGAIDMVKGWF